MISATMALQILSVAVLVSIFLTVVYLVVQRAYPRPLPGIPYNYDAAKKLMGDLTELEDRQKNGGSMRPWFLEQAGRHNSAITQIFLGPFAKPAVLISDYVEVNDILSHRDAVDFKRGKKVDVFSGVLPHAHPAMETFDPRFKSSRDLVRDLMVPSFLNKVSEYIMLCFRNETIQDLIGPDIPRLTHPTRMWYHRVLWSFGD
jgi:hypothetical protein